MNQLEADALLWTNLLMGAGVAALMLASVLVSVASALRARREARVSREPLPAQ